MPLIIRISDIAQLCQAPESAVIAAAKILGYRRIGATLAFSKKPGADFVREIDYHAGLHRRAEQRRACNLENLTPR